MNKINTKTGHLINRISKSIDNKESLSVIRCGDGELHILKNNLDFDNRGYLIHKAAIKNILNRNNIFKCNCIAKTCGCYLNSSISLEWICKMKTYIIDAIKNSNYIGLYANDKDFRFYGISQKTLERYNINANELRTIDSTFSRSYEFGNLKNFKNIIKNNDIHIVTSNVKNFKEIKIDKKLDVNVTFTDISNGKSFIHRDFIKESLEKSNKKIFLFGGGAAIKDIIQWSAKEFGSVSIDVGSVLDAWAGVKSRKYISDIAFSHLNWTNL